MRTTPASYLQNHRAYRFSEPGVPQFVYQYASPTASYQEAVLTGIYAQDQWTIDRLTLNLGVRYDHLNGWVPAQTIPRLARTCPSSRPRAWTTSPTTVTSARGWAPPTTSSETAGRR